MMCEESVLTLNLATPTGTVTERKTVASAARRLQETVRGFGARRSAHAPAARGGEYPLTSERYATDCNAVCLIRTPSTQGVGFIARSNGGEISAPPRGLGAVFGPT